MKSSSFRLLLYTILVTVCTFDEVVKALSDSRRSQWLFSLILLSLTAARLNYTLHLPEGDPLNHGSDFYGQGI